MPYLTLNDTQTVFYTDEGSGQPVLLIHGWACDGADWMWLADDFVKDHRVIIADNRGHGRSSLAADGYSPRQSAGDSAALLDALGLRDVVVVGHSMGGLIASALAVERPELVGKLILIDPAYGRETVLLEALLSAIKDNAQETAVETFANFYVDATPQWLVRWHRRRVLGTPEEVVRGVIVAAYQGKDGIGSKAQGAAYLQCRQAPILAIYAGVNTDLAEWDGGLKHDPRSKYILWPENGHFLHQEAPEHFAQTLRNWLTSLQ